ncbi:MAG: DUF4277 domain-containing protein [Gemmatimonadaceae bacterium]|nr:DUF4277 domain-containing protein [Gloeobacterales cyanobacterium ES-bin-141]
MRPCTRQHVTSGRALKGLILNGFGFASAPLYLFEQFFVDCPVWSESFRSTLFGCPQLWLRLIMIGKSPTEIGANTFQGDLALLSTLLEEVTSSRSRRML